MLNALFYSMQFWDGRAATLEDQARLPIVNPILQAPGGRVAAMTCPEGGAAFPIEFPPRRAMGVAA